MAKNYKGEKTIFQEFNLSTSERPEKRVNKAKPDFIIDAKIAPGKVVSIPIYRTDNAQDLSDAYSKVYMLNKETKELLKNIL
jgi:hypothetical protein